MRDGYAGKILILHLDTETSETIDTEPYKEWIGGHAMGTKLWWDYVKDHTNTDPFSDDNTLVIATSPVSGTPTPSAGGRCEMLGIGTQLYPTSWFTRSNCGGRLAPMMKHAGYDAWVIMGKAKRKIWIKIVNDKVEFHDAADLWDLDAQQTQEILMPKVFDDFYRDGWNAINPDRRDEGFTTQRPVVLTTGPKPENYGPLTGIICDAGHIFGQGGFGGVWGDKNLKAIGVIGSKSIEIADPQAMIDARIWAKDYTWGGHDDEPFTYVGMPSMGSRPNAQAAMFADGVSSRPYGCVGCARPCRGRTSNYYGNEAMCLGMGYMVRYDTAQNGKITGETTKAATLMNRLSINVFSMMAITKWLAALYAEGVLGKGKEIDSDLPFDNMGSAEFTKALLWSIIDNTDIGADLALGLRPCAEKWGRWEQDSATGLLPCLVYSTSHHYDPRTTPDWGYCTILSERDINSHDLDYCCYWTPSINAQAGIEPDLTAAELVEICGRKMVPFGEPDMCDYSTEGIYKEPAAKATAWLLYYNRSWKNSVGFCDWAWVDFINPYGPGFEGMTPEGEPKFWNAASGRNDTFEDMIWFGKKAYDFDRIIWQLQGRTRDDEVFADYIYDTPNLDDNLETTFEIPYVLPMLDEETGEWSYKPASNRSLTREGVEQLKTYFYEFEGCDVEHGWLKRSTLEAEGLGFTVAEAEAAGVLGNEDE